MSTTQQPDVAGAVLALDQAMIALAVAKSALLGEPGPVIDLAAAELSPANPYGSPRRPRIIPVKPRTLANLRDRQHYSGGADEGPARDGHHCGVTHPEGYTCGKRPGHLDADHVAYGKNYGVKFRWPAAELQAKGGA